MVWGTVLGLAVIIEAGAAQGQPLDDNPVSARTMALAGGTHAVASSTSAPFSNPAGMGLARVYHVDSTFLYDPTYSRWALGGVIVDSTRTVGAALAYSYGSISEGTVSGSGHDIRLSLSATLTEGIAIGVTGRYMDHPWALGGPNGRAGVGFSGFTLDAGVVVKPVRYLSIGATGYSLTDPNTTVTPLSLGVGLGVLPIETLTLVADMIWDFHSYESPRARYSGGVELLLSRIPVRAGYAFDEGRGTHAVSFGLGYLDQLVGIEAALRQEVSGGDQTTILVALRYFHQVF